MKKFNLRLLVVAIMMLPVVLCTNKIYAYNNNFYLTGDPTGWNNYIINYGDNSGNHQRSIYIYVAKDNYVALSNGSNQYGPSSNGTALPTTGTKAGYNGSNSWKYTGNSGILKIRIHEEQEWYPWVWYERSDVYIKHDFVSGGDWEQYKMNDNNDGTYWYKGTYNGGKANAGWQYCLKLLTPTVVGASSGDYCIFEYNANGYKGNQGTEEQNTGSMTITKLCNVTYNANGGSGSAPSNQTDIKYNTSTTLQKNTGGLYKDGYTFAGWNTDPDGGGTNYVPGKSYTITSNLTLYAKWIAKDRSMYFYKNNSDWTSSINAYLWQTSPNNWDEISWSGRAMTEHQDNIYRYDYASSVFNKVQFNAGEISKKTGDLTIPNYDQAFYNPEGSGTWTQYIMVAAFPTETIAAVLGEKITVEPVVAWADGVAFYDISITAERASGSSNVNVAVAGTKLVVTATAAGTATFTITYTYLTTTITKTLTVDIKDGIVVQAKISKADTHWTYTNIVKIHYWGNGIAASDLTMTWMKADATYNYFQALVPKGTDNNANFLFYYDYMKDEGTTKWRQTNNITDVTAQKCYTISYSGSESSHANCTASSNLCVSSWQVQIVMGSGDIYSSNIVDNSSGTISFFAPGNKGGDPSYRKGTVTLEHNGTTVATLSSAGSPAIFSESGVYTAKINTSNYTLTNVALYDGDYYIRTDGADGGWDNYKTSGKDNGMTGFTRNTNFPNETFSYYWVKNVAKNSTVNIKATVANDYNPVLCNFTADDKVTGDANGVNIRFGYEPTTNDIVRGILQGSTNNNFLNIIGLNDNIYKESARTTCLNEARYSSNPGDSKFDDLTDWVYGRVVYAYVASSTSTADVVLKSYFNGTHYLLGMEKDASGHETSTPVQFPVIKTGTTPGTYPLRVVYDFKTNRLFAAWAPEGTTDVSTVMNVDADVIFLKHEKEDAAQINITSSSAKVDNIQQAIFALELEDDSKQLLGNRELHYWITLPFNCKVSNIFGIGKFMTYWGIQRYRGDLRAQKGWFIETDSFWEWLSPDYELEAGVGYLLSVDKKALQTGGQWKEYGGKSLLTLYFPSTTAGFSITQATGDDLTIEYVNQPCSVEYKNRHLQDGNWKVIGTPGYKNITISSATNTNTYNLDKSTPPKFLYVFNEQNTSAVWAAGTYTATSTSGFTFQSFTSYMVQFAGTINWAAYSKSGDASAAPARRKALKGAELTQLQLDLLSEDRTVMDRAYVWLRDDATIGFDQNFDLNKIVEGNANQIYSLAEFDVPFAANVLPLETDTVKLVVNIAQDGDYIISLPQDEHRGMSPILYDVFKNKKINLLADDYEVTLEKGKYNDRFLLLFQAEAPVVTSFDTTEDGGQNVQSGEIIYDVLGRRVNTVYPGQLYIVNGKKHIAK